MVLRLPSGKVVVLLKVEVKELSVVGAEVVDEEEEELVVVVRVDCTELDEVVLDRVLIPFKADPRHIRYM